MSSITILATFALAMPMKERGPVWSVITPNLMGRPDEAAFPSALLMIRTSWVVHDRRWAIA
jgi:hypothetical protein